MSEFGCDRCGRALLVDEDVRYKLEIKITSQYDALELTPDILDATDGDGKMKRLIAAAEKRTAEELEAEVHKEFTFDICHLCQREIVKNPLPPRVNRSSGEG